jgi:uncharacterized protein YndB with AHSA1/START domain
MPKTNLHQQIFIDALPSKVWKVLTNCDYIHQYFPDTNVHSQWTEGSAIISKQEETETLQKGKVLQAVPGVLLKYKLLEEVSSSFVTITYEIIPADNGVELQFHCEGFADADEDYLFRLKETQLLLQKIKWLAEYA